MRKILTLKIVSLALLASCRAAGGDTCLSNGVFAVELDSSNGGLSSLRLHDDPDRMNWIEGLETWGVPVGMEFAGVERPNRRFTCPMRGSRVARFQRAVQCERRARATSSRMAT